MSHANAFKQPTSRAAQNLFSAPMSRLRECDRFPAHVRDILQGLLGLCATGLETRISATLAEFEKQLIRLADKATIHQQNQYFDSVQVLKRGRGDVMPRFLGSLEHTLAHLGEDVRRPARTRDAVAPAVKLALTDSVQLDESLVLSDIATKVELRVREPLYALGHRFGVLAATSRIATEGMPLGPRALAEAMRHAAAELDLPLEHRLVLYRCFERVVMNEIVTFYGALNNFLAQRGVLPDLHALLPAEPAANSEAIETAPPAPAATRLMRELRTPPPVRPVDSARRVAALASADARSDPEFASLKQLLSDCRRAEAYVASGAELQAMLAAMQMRHAAAGVDAPPALLSGEQIKQEIVTLLQDRSGGGRAPRIDDEDGDAIDLIAMLFEFLSRRARANGLANWILAKLQIPVLRAALADKRFFSERTHAARRLVNDLLETGRFWVDEVDADKDPTLPDKLQLITNQVAAEYQGNALVFCAAQQELSRHIDALARKVEVAERRQVEAAIGREKLEYSRQLAAAAIAARIERCQPNEFVRTLLERAWIDVLAVSLLRDGEGSDSHARRLAVVDLLLDGAQEDAPDAQRAERLRAEVESGLTQVGLHAEDVRAITRRIFAGADDAHDEDPISQTELAIKLKSKARLGGAPAPAAEAATAGETDVLTAEAQAALSQLQTLPAGTWFEFKVNALGDTVRRKLSWYSTHSGRCLLINQRGIPEERTMMQLAREMGMGNARIVSAEQESLIDRAWAEIGENLRNFSARKQVNRFDVRPALACVPAGSADDAAPEAHNPRTLLLVDDEENILRALNRVLRGEGYRILSALNAREALEVLRENEVQVIVSDQRMPEISGTEFLGTVKTIYPDTVRIMLSGYSDVAAVTDAINRGTIYKFLTKPWDDDDIRLQVRDAFRAAKLA